MIYKHKDVTANINSNNINVGNIGGAFYTEDENTAVLNINLEFNGIPYDLTTTDMTPRLDLICADGSIFTKESIEVLNAQNGIMQYVISENVIKHAGKVNAKLFLENENDSVHAANFNFTIYDSGVEGVVGKEIHVTLIEDTVRKIMKENSLGLLDNGFLEKVKNDFKEFTSSNPELFKGERGEQGIQGIQGIQGVQGEKGEQGEQGIQGEKGEQGVQGMQGVQGVEGVPGTIPDTTTWQKSKLTSDNGILDNYSGLDFNNPEILLGNKTVFGYTGTSTNFPTGASGTGYFKYIVRTTNYIKMEYRPFNGNRAFERTKLNGVWGNWSELYTSDSYLNVQNYKLTNDDGTRKYLKGLDPNTCPPGFYETTGMIDCPIPGDSGLFYVDVTPSSNGRRLVFCTYSAGNRTWVKTIHTGGVDKGWVELTPTETTTGWLDIPLKNGVTANTDKPQYKITKTNKLTTISLRGAVRTTPDQIDLVIGTIPVSDILPNNYGYIQNASIKNGIPNIARFNLRKSNELVLERTSITSSEATETDWIAIGQTITI